MAETTGLEGTRLMEREKTAVTDFCNSLQESKEIDVKSIILYGSGARDDFRPGISDINLMVVLSKIDLSVLRSALDPVTRARRSRIAPFFITEANLRSSADVFPVKFLSIRESYRVLLGEDILGELSIDRSHLRLRCEQEIKTILLRLRRTYFLSAGKGLAEIIPQVAGRFIEILRWALSITRDEPPAREDVIGIAAQSFGINADTLRKAVGLRDQAASMPREEAEQLYGDFMEIVETVAMATDKMESG